MNDKEDGKKPGGGHGHEDHLVPIIIDKHEYKVKEEPTTGAALRQVPDPPVSDDRDLWERVPGEGDDVKVLPETVVEIKAGMHFFTAPRTINPGGTPIGVA